MGHVTSPDQSLSSKRGKSLGTRLSPYLFILIGNEPTTTKEAEIIINGRNSGKITDLGRKKTV
jgi:hypothetical protein